MRKSHSTQHQLNSVAIGDVCLKLNSRNKITRILRGLQEVYKKPERCDEILQLIAGDVNTECLCG